MPVKIFARKEYYIFKLVFCQLSSGTARSVKQKSLNFFWSGLSVDFFLRLVYYIYHSIYNAKLIM